MKVRLSIKYTAYGNKNIENTGGMTIFNFRRLYDY